MTDSLMLYHVMTCLEGYIPYYIMTLRNARDDLFVGQGRQKM